MRWYITPYWTIALIIIIQGRICFCQMCMSSGSMSRPDTSNCARYYECLYGQWRLQECNPGMLYDMGEGTCVPKRFTTCFMQNSGGFNQNNFNVGSGHNTNFMNMGGRDRYGKSSSTRVEVSTETMNGGSPRTTFTVHNSNEPSYTFTINGYPPNEGNLLEWVQENAHKYQKTYLDFEENGSTEDFTQAPPPRRPTWRPPPMQIEREEQEEEDTAENDEDVLPSECGLIQKPSPLELKITNGKVTTIEKNPWQVALLDKFKFHMCGGSIITTKHVLTAAHCFFNQETSSWKKPNDVIVRVGDNDKEVQDPKETDLYVYEIYRHQKYGTEDSKNDIAIIKVRGQMSFSRQVFPICLPADSMQTRYDPGRQCIISGWGATKEKGDVSRLLQSAEVPFLDQKTCNQLFPQKIVKGMVCAGDLKRVEVDSCQGDSGGPLACLDNDHYFLYGITSWGEGCGRKPGVYTKVSKYHSWIKRTILESK